MKKNLLTLSLVGVCAFVNAQLTYVGNGALVHVQDKALVYSGGGVKLDGNAKVNTIGDFMVVTPSQSFEVAPTADFRLQYSSSSVYGQLYIKGMPQANITGKVNKEYVDVKHGNTGRQQVALPFYNYSITDLQASLPHINVANSALTVTGRFNKRSVFKWNNTTAAFDQLTTTLTPTVVGKPTDYYILSRRLYDGTEVWNPTLVAENPNANLQGYVPSSASDLYSANSMKKIFKGVPVSDLNTADTEVTLSGAFNGSFGTNGAAKNAYNEIYNTYVDDPFVTTKWSADYGKNLYQHGNPYLTNIDLSLVKKGTLATDDENAISNLNGISYYTSGIENSFPAGTTYTSTSAVVRTFDSAGNVNGGFANDLVIKPMQEFMIKLADNTSQTLKFSKTRRFAQTARPEATPYSVTARVSNAPVVTKQLGVVLYDANDTEIGRTFYIVNNEAVSGFSPENARMQATTGSTSIYTKEEQVSGGADVNANYNLFINEANEVDFSGKEIPLVVNNANAAKLKFFLIEGGKLVEDKGNLSNGKSFYYSNNGTLTKIKSGDTFSLTNTNFTYGLFYEQPAGVLGTSELLKGQTIVAKKDQGYVVRFNKNWKQADIEVYSSVGQLLHSAKKVSTYDDYKLPLDNVTNGVYIVKIKSNDGEIVTKKVIK
jgi:hypothetical protein